MNQEQNTSIKNGWTAEQIAPAFRASQVKDGRFPVVRFFAELDTEKLKEKANDNNYTFTSATELNTDYFKELDQKDILIVDDLGVFVSATEVVELSSKVNKLGLKVELNENQRTFPSYKRMFGKVAVVTGAAQGFGEGIARELAKEAAYVVIADLNAELAETVASSLNEEFGEDTAISCKVDVANEESVEALISKVVDYYGSVDLMVCSAGVLKAGGLELMDLKSFEFVTKINYTAFFVCTKYAARPMKIQNSIAGDGYGDIVQINSKSGLEGSNKNFAYAGGKFGGIGLVQSFAKELVTDRIKVNAVCPGNYYEGPLWSDPERGLFKQYLESGKVEGAKTVEDVYDFYIKQVPMRKGCSPLDVTRAIMYIVEQENETGQAVPITGGQVMMN